MTPDLDLLRKRPEQHKYDHGHALILSGPRHRTGAARLAARAALRIGAGLVTLGATERTLPELASQSTAVMLTQIETGAALSAALEADPRINALCVGPGLGVNSHGGDLVLHAVEAGRPVVLDADALSLIAKSEFTMKALHPHCVLTPHSGEFGRLFPDLAEKAGTDKEAATHAAAARAGCTVLLKGALTVIATPEGEVTTHDATGDRAAPWLATAGSGDVLAGFITGLLARGLTTKQAAETAAWLHVEVGLEVGPGLIAEDLTETLPRVLARLGG